MKTINEHNDYERNLEIAEKYVEKEYFSGFVKCRFSRDEANCAKAIVIISFQPPSCWLCGNYGTPISLGQNHEQFKKDMYYGLITIKNLAIEKLEYQKKYHPDLIEKSKKKSEPQIEAQEPDSWN